MNIKISFTTRNIPTNADERKAYIAEYYQKYIQGRSVVNLDTGLTINFNRKGRKKTAERHDTIQTVAVIKNLIEILKHAEYNNFGEPKPKHYKDFPSIKKFVNFKCRVHIDEAPYNYRISCMILKDNKIQYDVHENSIEYAAQKK